MDTNLETMYQAACRTPTDIWEHLPALRFYGSLCRHITEFGVREGISTVALLAAQPHKLVSYDLYFHPNIETLRNARGRTGFHFCQQNVLETEIEPTDLLFIDTCHTYNQLAKELVRHHQSVRSFIILHDITVFGHQNEIEDGSLKSGLVPALQEFLIEQPNWHIEQLYWNCNGLAVLRRSRNVL